MSAPFEGTGYDPYLYLAPNFQLFEFTRSRMAKSRGIPNRITEDHIIANLRKLSMQVLEPVRVLAGMPIRITSGYRSPALNAAVGGVTESQHLFGEAADITIRGDMVVLAQNIAASADIPFDQCILEERERAGRTTLGRWSRWIHLSYRAHGSNRREVLTHSIGHAGNRTERGIVPSPDDVPEI